MVWSALWFGCQPPPIALPGPDPLSWTPPSSTTGPVTATDVGPTSGYEDLWFGSYQRGRAAVVLDYDGDGRMDVLSGNPDDASFLIHNIGGDGVFAFEATQVFSHREIFWSGAAADYDNDGDTDLYIGVGGNEGRGFDRLMRNDHRADGSNAMAPFVDVTANSGLELYAAGDVPLETGTAGAIWFDLDNDAHLDLFASGHLQLRWFGIVGPQHGVGRNQLWHAQGDGTFADRAWGAGMQTQMSSRNSSVLDIDADGDLDIFENNYNGNSVLWRNEWVETATVAFTDVTTEFSLGGGDLAWPEKSSSMCSIATDLDNDGYDDLVVFRRGPKDEPGEPEVHDIGHLLWMNVAGQGFVEVAGYTDLNDAFLFRDHDNVGVMGCQVGDIDADGSPDLFVGNGGPSEGGVNQLFVSTHLEAVDIDGVGTVNVPWFEDWTELIDVASPGDPAYPYRTHGSAMADFDGDGLLEIAVHNGGPSTWGSDEQMQEPNRLWTFDLPDDPHWIRVHLVGDGVRVNRDGIGARVRVTVDGEGGPYDLFQTRRAGSGFGAQNDPELLFGLGQAASVQQIEVRWPDGTSTTVTDPGVDQVVEVAR